MKNSRTGSASRDHARADDQHIHPGPQEAVKGFGRRAHDALVFIKRGIQYHRNSCETFELLDEPPNKAAGSACSPIRSTSWTVQEIRRLSRNFMSFRNFSLLPSHGR